MSDFVFRLIPTFDRDMINEDCTTLEKDSPEKEGDFSPELVEFLKEGEKYIVGKELEKRTSDHADLAGQRELEAMLRKQENIPAEWRKYYLIGPKTVRLFFSGSRFFPGLYWNGEQWVLSFLSIQSGFSYAGRLVRSNKLFS